MVAKRGETSMQVTTQDLYCGAYILSNGGCLEEARLDKTGGRPSVTFVLSGQDVDKLAREFQSGQAMINLVSFKVAMTHLKDVMFATLRAAGEAKKTLQG
jgi:hypothetical protein